MSRSPRESGGFCFSRRRYLRGMERKTLSWAALVMLTAVALGAFGAHGLKGKVTPEALDQWNKGVQYQLVHGLALFGLLSLAGAIGDRQLRLARVFFLLGVLCFSGSLYLLSTREMLGTTGLTPLLGPLTPLGGLSFMAGWAVLLFTSLRKG